MQSRTERVPVAHSQAYIAGASQPQTAPLPADAATPLPGAGPLARLHEAVLRIPRELRLFIAASLAMGMAYSMFDATFNNFLDERFALTGFQRSFLELPRELPGFLVIFVSAALWFLCSRRLGAASLALSVVGALTLGFFVAHLWLSRRLALRLQPGPAHVHAAGLHHRHGACQGRPDRAAPRTVERRAQLRRHHRLARRGRRLSLPQPLLSKVHSRSSPWLWASPPT